jgi:hypothetical protein
MTYATAYSSVDEPALTAGQKGRTASGTGQGQGQTTSRKPSGSGAGPAAGAGAGTGAGSGSAVAAKKAMLAAKKKREVSVLPLSGLRTRGVHLCAGYSHFAQS